MILWTYATMQRRRDEREKETVAHYLSMGKKINHCPAKLMSDSIKYIRSKGSTNGVLYGPLNGFFSS